MRRVFSRFRPTPQRLPAIFALGLLVAGVAALHSTIFHRQLLSVVQKATGWKITIQDSSLKILRGRVRLTGVSAQDPKGNVDFQAGELYVGLSPFSLVGGKVHISRIEVSDPVVTVRAGGGGGKKFNPAMIDDLFRRFEQSSILKNIVLEEALIERLHLKIFLPKTPDEPREEEIARVRIAAKSTILNAIHIDVTLSDAAGNLPGLATTKSLHIDARIKRDDVRIEDFNWEGDKHALAFKSTWKGGLTQGSFLASGEVRVPSVLSDRLLFDVEADVKNKVAFVKDIAARLLQGEEKEAVFHAEGRIDLEDKIDYALTFNARELLLESIFSKIPSFVVGPARGLATVDGVIRGTIPELKAQARAKIHDLRHRSLHAENVEGTLDFHWPELDWNADIKAGSDGRVQGNLKGGIWFRVLPPMRSLKVTLKSLDFKLAGASVSDLVPTLDTRGTIHGDMHLQGVPGSTSVSGKATATVTQIESPLGPAESLKSEIAFQPGGEIVFTKTEMQRADISPVLWPNALTLTTSDGVASFRGEPMTGLKLEGTYDTKNEVFTISSFAVKRESGDLTGDLTYRGGVKRWAGRVKGLLPLSWLQHLPYYFRDGEGSARLDLAFDGTPSSPNLNGAIHFQKNAIEFRNFPSITDLEGTLAFSGASLRPNLTGYMGDGRFHLTGSAVTEGLKIRDYDLAFQGRDLTYSKSGIYRIDFDADVTLKGAWPSPRLSGRADVVDALYSKPFYVRDLILKPFEDSSGAAGPGTFDAVALDVAIRNSGDLKIKNNIAEIYLLADLHVGGTVVRPETRGAFTITDGEIRLFGEDFVLQEGRLEYIDPARKEPYLTLKAEQDIPPLYTVEVELKGFLSNLEINLNSTPPLPREDVVSLISTGLTLEDLRRSGRSRTSLGTNILANEISSVVERPIAKSTGLDVFRLEASESGSLSKVAVGKNVTDRLTLEFQSDFAPESAQRTIQANYYLTDNILLKGFRSWEKSNGSTTAPPYSVNLSFRVRMH